MQAIDIIKENLSMYHIAFKYDLSVNESGFMICPFHGEDKTPSLKIYEGNRGWYCFSCGQGGSVIDFVMKYFNLSLCQTIKKINTDFNLHLPETKEPTLKEQREQSLKRLAEMEEKERQDELKEIDKERYYNLLEQVQILNTYLRELAPQKPDDEINPLWLLAINNVDYVQQELIEEDERIIDKYGKF
jgi:DNA primase